MAIQRLQRPVENVEGFKVGGGWFCVTQFNRLIDATLTMGFIGVTEEDLCFPCLQDKQKKTIVSGIQVGAAVAVVRTELDSGLKPSSWKHALLGI